MPAHGLPPDEHRRRIEAVCQALAEGWRFPGLVVEPMKVHHGFWSTLMEKAIDGDP